jgi:hypothetical protein
MFSSHKFSALNIFLSRRPFTITSIIESSAPIEPNITPDYEVRLLINLSTVLSPTNKLIGTFLSTFGIHSAATVPPTTTKINIQFLDIYFKEMYTAG